MSNKLNYEKSPYLLQHAENPVDWYPWSDEAFLKAKAEDKPVFLSIGYSTCHWCHVMAHESFEDQQVAQLLNEAFVSVKVDREERPDIDGIYMTVCQLMTGSGGWPLTILMTHDRKPFLAATYIPKETRFGRVGMLDLIPRIKTAWKDRRSELLDSAEKILSAVRQYSTGSSGEGLSVHLLTGAYDALVSRFDDQYGGFGSAPKFPSPHNLLFLLRYWNSTGDQEALKMVESTLQAMRHGGIFDHVGFGFHRYSTDSEWLVPHFEKMLYDQAMLLMAFTEAYQATGKAEFRQTADEIITYVLRDMTSPEGGFYSAEDADSEGVEGKFYVWGQDEIRHVLEDKSDFVTEMFNVAKEGNYLEEASRRQTGENILHLKKPLSDEQKKRWDMARQRLFAFRQKRIHPHKDDKILADWNGLMIASLAKASQAFNEPKYANAACQAADFILDQMISRDGRLLHRFRDGEAAILGYADDYAFVVWGLLELFEATFDIKYLECAIRLNQMMMEHFWDEVAGGLFTSPDDGEELLLRQKEIYDGATPSANSVAMLNLLRLGRITGNTLFEDKASRIGKAFSGEVATAPVAYTQLLCALYFVLGPTYEVVIAGDFHSDSLSGMLRVLREKYIPNKVVLLNSSSDGVGIHQIAEFVAAMKPVDGKATAYVCRNYACSRPTSDLEEMMQLFDS